MPPFAARRHDPDILDRATFQRPAEMPFAGAATLPAILGKLPDIEIPGADEAAVEIHLAGAVGRGAVRTEGVEKHASHAALRPKAFCIASRPRSICASM